MIIWLAPFMVRFTIMWACWMLVLGSRGGLQFLFGMIWIASFIRLSVFLPTAVVGLKSEFSPSDRRARSLLSEWLPWKERARFFLCAKIKVKASNGKMYSISPRWINAVRCGTEFWCGNAKKVTIFDNMLAQYLLLKTNAEHFHRIAYGPQ